MRWLAVVLVVATLAVPATAISTHNGTAALDGATTSGEFQSNASASSDTVLAAVYPNPVPSGDRGEFVIVAFSETTNLSGWALTDGEGRVLLGNRTVSGRIAVTAHPSLVENLTDARVLAVDLPALANSGERIRLIHENATVDALRYRDAPEAETLGRDGRWRPLGATDLPIVHTGPTTARVFVLPDAPEVPISFLESASDRLLLAGYTFASERATRALVAAHERGVDVRVLVEGGPVGGLSKREAHLLDRLVAAGVEVKVIGGPYARYDFHHAKYAVADDRALVLTENWKPSGTGGRSSRGWGVVVADADAADALAATFRADAGWRAARPWSTVRKTVETFQKPPATGNFPTVFEPRTVRVRNASVLVAPENAERAVIGYIDAADESVRVLQPTLGGPNGPFVRASVRAARRGVEVKLLLSGAWYVREENEWLVEHLNALATREGLSLQARIADPGGKFEKIHAKGLLVDGETVVVGSLNWNTHSARQNREVLVAMESEAAASYYGQVFRADWRGAGWNLPLGMGAVVVVGAAVAVIAGREIEFNSGPRRPGE